MMSSRKGHAAARVINAGVVRLSSSRTLASAQGVSNYIREEASK
jgi:hypothetical protein